VADTFNDRIQKFSSGGAFIAKWGASGSGDGQFSSPEGVATDAAGNVYVADTFNDRIQKFKG
jgi:tripartite motif-containing protein 71